MRLTTKKKIEILKGAIGYRKSKNCIFGLCNAILHGMNEARIIGYVVHDVMESIGITRPIGSLGIYWWPLDNEYDKVRMDVLKTALRRQQKKLRLQKSKAGAPPKKILSKRKKQKK